MEKKDFLVNLAKEAIKVYLEKKEVISLSFLAEFSKRKAGVFVTLKKNGNLRGCVGTVLPIKNNILEELISNAILSAFFDERFPPLSLEELPLLSFEIHILSPLEKINDLSLLSPKKYGIFIFAPESKKSALLLPGIESIKTAKEQFLVACQKGGIDPKKEKVIMYRFETEKYVGS